ncbi:hypothetical protein [Mammaliicoccus sciuri]|uniref:hypothetical protein n=1 Tax=Mammaliicoccus sciuri TaxID=1296 RepID=UPI00047412C5|nr:hypothetical protein [Mammaliicoccus sciuri]
MNKRFTWKFTKYIFIFLTITFIIGVIGIWLFFTNVIKIAYSDLDEVDDFYMDFSISNKKNGYKLSDDLKQKLKDNHVHLYIIDKDANVLYPKKQMNLKNKLVENLYNTQAIPFRSDDYSVILIYPKSHNHHIYSIEEIDTKKLISSLYINNYNKYYHVEKDNQLTFIDNPAYHKVQYTDEFNDIENKTFKFLALTYLLLLLLNMILVIIFAFIISKRLSKPLFFYTDWIENLSKGKLFKPSSKHYNKRSKKLFKELNNSVESLVCQQ